MAATALVAAAALLVPLPTGLAEANKHQLCGPQRQSQSGPLTLERHSGWVRSVALSVKGQLLASGFIDNTIKMWNACGGTLKHTLSTDGFVTVTEISEHLPLLRTNIGSFDIYIGYEDFLSYSSTKGIVVSLGADRWVNIQGQRELWLFPTYQPSSSTVKDGIIAFGNTSGRVAIIAFSSYAGFRFYLW
ncbi:hypothetical protein BO85DRAFT_441090 [Aspergillus piperis CBS 112811]|uniref:WD40 repeat-like protein n=1 Tax=Aspergillus piperis CBS 112811 TaxID=1448313 RepID=A0A8G1QXY0_9EURO|nr:hypothetical protein BO85DRAFT_441090 [Aspergillus piperis CBS 112811]RAH54644.1 hypothetical protein BO85DRAFT_441090 [Aspergillus piperis CBS 112811]